MSGFQKAKILSLTIYNNSSSRIAFLVFKSDTDEIFGGKFVTTEDIPNSVLKSEYVNIRKSEDTIGEINYKNFDKTSKKPQYKIFEIIDEYKGL